MQLVDWLVLAAYLGLVVGIGVLHSRQRGLEDFFQADGGLPWWAVGLSLIATSVSASSFLGTPAESFGADLRLLQLNLAPFVSLGLVWAVFLPKLRRMQAASAYEILERRFDLKTRTLAAGLYLLHVLLRTGVLVYGPALMLSTLTGVPVWATILLVAALATLYAALGGLRAVVWSDALQFLVLVGGALAAFWVIVEAVPGGASSIFAEALAEGKLRVFDLRLAPGDARSFASAGVAYIVLDLAIRTTDQQFVQRYMAVRNLRAAQLSTLLAVVCGLAVSLAFFLLGAFLWGYYRLGPASLPEGLSADQVLPHFIGSALPTGLTGLLVAAVAAAAMSSVDSALNALTNTAVVDGVQRLLGRQGSLRLTRWLTLLWGALGAAAGLLAASWGENLLHTALGFTSLLTGSLLGLFGLALLTREVRGTEAFVAALSGIVLLAVVKPLAGLSWPWHPAVSFGGTLGSAAVLVGLRRMRGAGPASPG